MEIFNLSGITMDECYFVVHTPVRTAVRKVPRDIAYGAWLIATAKLFWEERYLQNYVLKTTGKLKEGEVV